MTDSANPAAPARPPLIVTGGTPKGETCMRALDLETGAIVWQTMLPKVPNKSTTAIGDGLVVLVTGEGGVYCMDHDSGEALWSQQVELPEKSNRWTPLVLLEGGRVIIGLQGWVSCFARDGGLLWRQLVGTGAIGVSGRVSQNP